MPGAVGSADSATAAGSVDRIRTFVRERPVVVAVLALTVIGLLARFYQLGLRPAHWDEARVANWVDYAAETGNFAYNSHTHGPFVQHTARYLFELFGASDFTARAPVALVGGLLPLSALLYREHLDDVETVVLAGFLTANPVLLYYSRFMRSDLLVATFMFTAFGLLVRFYDTRRLRYVYAATAFAVLGIGSKENAVLYILTWIGAAALLVDAALYRPRTYASGSELLAKKALSLRDRVAAASGHRRFIAARYAGHALAIGLLAVGLFVFLFAPRGNGVATIHQPPGKIGLWEALSRPTALPGLVRDTLSHTAFEYFAFGGGLDVLVIDVPGPAHAGAPDYPLTVNEAAGANPDRVGVVRYGRRLVGMLGGLWWKALPLVAFAVVGFVRERYGAKKSRNLVLFMFYAGLASVVGYPAALSIGTGWKWDMTHVLVPLAVPAAVGLGIVVRNAFAARRREAWIEATLSILIVVAVTLVVVQTAIGSAYAPQDRSVDNVLVQYGQPADDLRPALDRIETIAAKHEGTDVLLYDGSNTISYVDDPNATEGNFEPACSDWGNTLPINWYLAASDARSDCVVDPQTLENATSPPDPVPVVIAHANDGTVPVAALDSYHKLTYRLRINGQETEFYIHSKWW